MHAVETAGDPARQSHNAIEAGAYADDPADLVTVTLPSLGRYLRQIRERQHHPGTRRRLSREQAARRIGLSAAYLNQIESDRRVPTRQALQLLATGYGLSEAQFEFIKELRDPPVELRDLTDTRQRHTATAAMAERLARLDQWQIMAGYFDPLWYLVSANHSLRQAFPGLKEAGNLAVWCLSPTAEPVLLDPPREIAQMAALMKTALGRHRSSAAAERLLRQLARSARFRTAWTGDIDVAYTRRPSDPLYIKQGRDVFAVSVEDSIIPDGATYLRLILGIRTPLSAAPHQIPA